ncbi:hypothetical protein JOB18_001334 [Solea senegalensis]|uniref:Reverse transcriptase RNase H-like domain-containing protein n=1 Tax=Solea senegalensis TaxID=28829 RepID=A0AAV6SPR1_SOLSE|nr:hypothetical protein JOB18_001334 [Solea senegalensis]
MLHGESLDLVTGSSLFFSLDFCYHQVPLYPKTLSSFDSTLDSLRLAPFKVSFHAEGEAAQLKSFLGLAFYYRRSYYSRRFGKADKRYGVKRRALLAVVLSIRHLKYYLYGHAFVLRLYYAALQWFLQGTGRSGKKKTHSVDILSSAYTIPNQYYIHTYCICIYSCTTYININKPMCVRPIASHGHSYAIDFSLFSTVEKTSESETTSRINTTVLNSEGGDIHLRVKAAIIIIIIWLFSADTRLNKGNFVEASRRRRKPDKNDTSKGPGPIHTSSHKNTRRYLPFNVERREDRNARKGACVAQDGARRARDAVGMRCDVQLQPTHPRTVLNYGEIEKTWEEIGSSGTRVS